jgi:PAS domain S-box-containing protein
VDYAIFQLDKDGLVATWNRGAERIKGYSADEIMGRHFSVFYTEEDRAADVPAKTLETAASEGRFEAEARRVRKDGTHFWAAVVVDPIRNDNEEIVGFASVTRDITERVDQRAAALTQRLLAFSRRQPLNPVRLDLNNIFPAWANFCNSRDAMPNGGKLTVKAFNGTLDADYRRTNPEVAPRQYALISVSDTGHGMTPDLLARAFEPFFTTKEVGHETGLGLSQVYGLVKQSGGYVKIYSEVGHGTTVKLYFPRAHGNADDVDDDSDASRGSVDSEVILVVEDNHDLRWYLIEALRDLDYQTIGAPDAGAALAILEQPSTKVDLMLTDVIMPGMNGRELSERARELRPGLKVLFMSGYLGNAVEHHGRAGLDVQLVQKPVSLKDLTARIRDTLDRIA